MRTISHERVRVAPGHNRRPGGPGPTLTTRLRDVLRRARPDVVLLGVRLPRDVTEASRADSALLTRTFERAIDALIADTRVATARLCDLGLAVVCHVRARRGEAPDLAAAMRREQATNAALDIRQWCADGLTVGDLVALRDAAGAQMVASGDLMVAADVEIARRSARMTA